MVPLRLIIEGRGACWTRRLPRLRSEEVLHSRCGGRMSRRNETKDSATWHVRARPQLSVMRFDNRPADRQPKPQTARFRGVESLFRESIPHPVQPLSTLRTPRYRDARKTRSRPACSALDGPDFHWQAHSSFPIAPRTRLLPLIGFLRVNYRLEKEGPFDPGEMILSGSIP